MRPIVIAHEPCRTRGDCYHARIGRIGGRIGGRTNVESGHLARLNADPHQEEWRSHAGNIGGRNQPREAKVRGGRIGGRIAVESGQIAALGRKNVESGRIQGPIQGRKNVESGHIAALGHIQGIRNVKNGHLARIAKGIPSTANNILFRSQTEAMFYCVTQELCGEPTYEPTAISLPDGRLYTPDFVLSRSVLDIPANVPIELKPARNAFYNDNLPKAIAAGAFVVYWNELVEEP